MFPHHEKIPALVATILQTIGDVSDQMNPQTSNPARFDRAIEVRLGRFQRVKGHSIVLHCGDHAILFQ
jgi:hypothetical protein